MYLRTVLSDQQYPTRSRPGCVTRPAAKFEKLYICHHHQYSALEAGLAGTRAQSCDRYGSGTLHPGQVLEGQFAIVFPRLQTFPLSPPGACTSATTRDPSSERWNCGRERCPAILPKFRLPRKFRYLLHAVNLRHGSDGFTSPPKEGVLRIFSP